jgi:hypothetical protein
VGRGKIAAEYEMSWAVGGEPVANRPFGRVGVKFEGRTCRK